MDCHVLSVSLHDGRGERALWSIFYQGTSPIHEASTLMIYFPLYSTAPSFQYTFCKTNSTQQFSLYPPKIFFECTNFLNQIFHPLWFRMSSFQAWDYIDLCGLCIWAGTSNSVSISGNTQKVYIPHLIDIAWIFFLLILFCSMFPLPFSRKGSYTFKIPFMC